MNPERKYRFDATDGKTVPSFTIKEIFQNHWDDFVIEMANQNKTIRPTIMEEVAKIIGCAVAKLNQRICALFMPQVSQVSRCRSTEGRRRG
jgi:hypothetical protein